MAKKRGPGRPEIENPAEIPLNLRVTAPFKRAAERYRKRKNLASIGRAVKEAAEVTLRAEGLL